MTMNEKIAERLEAIFGFLFKEEYDGMSGTTWLVGERPDGVEYHVVDKGGFEERDDLDLRALRVLVGSPVFMECEMYFDLDLDPEEAP